MTDSSDTAPMEGRSLAPVPPAGSARAGADPHYGDYGYGKGYGTAVPPFDLGLLIQKYWLLIACLLAAGLGLGLVYVGMAQKLYSASGDVILNVPETHVIDIPYALEPEPVSQEKIDTEIEVLRSKSILVRAIDKLGLMTNPAFVTGAALRTEDTAPAAQGQERPNEQVPGHINNGPANTGPLDSGDADALKNDIVRQIQDHLTVALVGTTFVARVTYQSPSPELSAKVTNAIIAGYIANQIERQEEATKRANAYIVDRLNHLRTDMLAAKRKVAEQRKKEGLIDVAGMDSAEKELSLIYEQAVENDTALSQARAKLDGVQKVLNTTQDVKAIAQQFQTDTLKELAVERAKAVRAVGELVERYGDRHPSVRDARSSVAEIDRQIKQELHSLASNLRTEVAVLETRKDYFQTYTDKIRNRLYTANQETIEINALQAQADVAENLYDTFLKRAGELQQQGLFEPKAQVLVWAATPPHPSSPKTAVILVLSFLSAGVFAFCFILALELRTRGYNNVADLEQALNLFVVGSIPEQDRMFNLRSFKQVSPAAYMVHKSGSPIARGFRRLFDNLCYQFEQDPIQDGRGRVITLTSSIQGEGKTTSALCLARTAALRGMSALIIDGDLWRPGLSRATSLAQKPGLSDLIASNHPFEDFIYREGLSKNPNYRLHVLPAGKSAALHKLKIDEIRIFQERRFVELVRWARQNYQIVIIDTPPILAVSDVRELCRLSDHTVLAVRYGVTPKAIVQSCVRELRVADIDAPHVLFSRIDSRHASSAGNLGTSGYYKYLVNYFD